MKNINRFISLTKRILSKKLYIALLIILVTITAIYKLLPERQKSAYIKVGIYQEEISEYADKFKADLESQNSLYKFYEASDREQLISDVKSGYAECGFYIPEGFFEAYINGDYEGHAIELYITPSTTLSSAISETVYASVLSTCAEDILVNGTGIYEYKDELIERMENYLCGDELFKVISATEGSYDYKTESFHIDLHIYELILILIIFTGLLGYYSYTLDSEKSIYIALKTSERFGLKCLYIISAVLPITLTGILCAIISSYGLSAITGILLCSLAVIAGSVILSFIIKKSTLLEKVLPLIMLISIVGVFINSMM